MSENGVLSSTIGFDGTVPAANMAVALGWLEWLEWILIMVIGAVCVKSLLAMIYNVYFHPLRDFPGPKLGGATPFPFVWHLATGRPVPWIKALHAKYGVVVRIHPDELSFIEASAWKDIYISPRPQFAKPIVGAIQTPTGVPSMVLQPDPEIHHRQRKIIGHAFSRRALQEQEYILQKWTDLLTTRLHDQGSEVNICDWYSFVTFDIIGDLCFGESFRCLETGESHAWLVANFKGTKYAQLLTIFDHFPPLGAFVKWALKSAFAEKVQQMYIFSRERIDRRIASKSDRSDFMKYILENNYPGGMTREEIDVNTSLLVLAGSETSALTLTGATYFALSNPLVMQRLQREIREAFAKNSSKVTVSAVSELPYLHAVIQETLRMHPTAAVSGPRQVDRPTEICGMKIPPGVRVGIPQSAAFRSSLNFVEPDNFIPERWLDGADPKFAQDDKEVFEPFLVGPRNCIGMPLAWAEMKLILTKVLLKFDLQLSTKNVEDWADDKVYLLAQKQPLYVKLTPRM